MSADRTRQRPEPGWRPDPDGGTFMRWWNGREWTKRVQAEPDGVPPEPFVRTVRVVTPPVVEEIAEEESSDDSAPSAAWGVLATSAATLSALGILSAILLPVRLFPLIVSGIGAFLSIVALVLAWTEGNKRVAAVWGIGLGLVGLMIGVMLVFTS